MSGVSSLDETSTLITATSLVASEPTSVALAVVPSANVTLIEVAFSTTCVVGDDVAVRVDHEAGALRRARALLGRRRTARSCRRPRTRSSTVISTTLFAERR